MWQLLLSLSEKWFTYKIYIMNLWNKYRISNEFSFHTMYYEASCVFYIPEPLAREYKTNNEFHNTSHEMKIHLRFSLSHELTRNEQITRWNRLFPRIGDGWRHGLLRLDNKFAWYSVITIQRRSHFTIVEIQNTKTSMFWCNNKSKFAVWKLAYIHERAVIFFWHGKAAFRMRRSLCNVLS